jgi:hypothetical protein
VADVVIDYVQHGPLTVIDPDQRWLLDGLLGDPVSICESARTLVVSPEDAMAAGVPEDRLKEQDARPVRDLLAVLARLRPERLDHPRPPEARVVGTSRHSATLACSMLRAQGYAARVRCGFRTAAGQVAPRIQWITEWWSTAGAGWIRMDAEPAGLGPQDGTVSPEAPADFVTAGEAWQVHRSGSPDRPAGGPPGADRAHLSPEISAGVVRDLAALCKLEMLPTDTWGRMAMPQYGFTSAAYVNLIDVVASLSIRDEPEGLARLFASADLAVPPDMIDMPPVAER